MKLAARRIVAGRETLDGWVELDGGRITHVTASGPPPDATDLGDAVLVPGYVDIHVHGGGGATMTTGDPELVATAAAFHRTHGTTTTLASLVTAPLDALLSASQRIAAMIDSGGTNPGAVNPVGIHLEGPFLATRRCGAQNPAHMIDPTPDAVDALIEAGGGHLRQVTIAPERPGAIDAIGRFVAADVVAAIGHTDANTAETSAAIAAGATLATHLGNAMSPLHHREPGPIGACLAAAGVTCELIADGHHLHPTMIAMAAAAKGPDRFALITDAIRAAGAGDGSYLLGELSVEVVGGVARLTAGGALAGSTLTMDRAVANAVSAGVPLVDAVTAATATPARVIGLSGEIGTIAAGKHADLVVLNRDLTVRAVIAAGEVVAGSLT